MATLVDSPEFISTQEGYDRWAEVYDEEDNPLVAVEESVIGSLIGDVRDLHIVDVGCGTGRHATRWAERGGQVTAVDFSEQMLERARFKPGADRIRFIQHDVTTRLPLGDGGFDLVTSCLVLEHIPDLRRFFGELRRICGAGGAVIATAMHPSMLLRGTQARFTDPGSGRKTCPLSFAHETSDILMAALESGLELEHVSEHRVDKELASRMPRASKYLGWPILLMTKFRR